MKVDQILHRFRPRGNCDTTKELMKPLINPSKMKLQDPGAYGNLNCQCITTYVTFESKIILQVMSDFLYVVYGSSSKSISVEDAQPLQEKKSVSKSKSVGMYGSFAYLITLCSCIQKILLIWLFFFIISEKPRERRRQILVEEEEDLEPSIRRSARQRRGVYDTLNINMLTDHRYVHSFDAFHLHEVKKRKKMQKRRDLEDEDFFEVIRGFWFEFGAILYFWRQNVPT